MKYLIVVLCLIFLCGCDQKTNFQPICIDRNKYDVYIADGQEGTKIGNNNIEFKKYKVLFLIEKQRR